MKKEPTILCCGRVEGKLLLPDNLTGPCKACGATVQYRPHAPKPFILRCMECTVALLDDDDRITTTPQMIADARAFFRRQKH